MLNINPSDVFSRVLETASPSALLTKPLLEGVSRIHADVWDTSKTASQAAFGAFIQANQGLAVVSTSAGRAIEQAGRNVGGVPGAVGVAVGTALETAGKVTGGAAAAVGAAGSALGGAVATAGNTVVQAAGAAASAVSDAVGAAGNAVVDFFSGW